MARHHPSCRRSVAPVCATLALVYATAGCDQPAPHCNVAHGAFWAKYTLVSGEGACAMLTGEQLDVQSYYAPRSKTDKRPDYDAVSIAIQPLTITAALANAAGLAEPEPDDAAYGMGRIVTTTPAADGFCRADSLSKARLRLPSVPEHALDMDMCTTAPEAPAYDISYEFSHVRVYYTPSAIGTQFEADLKYTQDDCVAQYKVSAVYPMVSCAATPASTTGNSADLSDDAGEPESDAAATDGGVKCPPPPPPGPAPSADDSLCENAGINPDFALRCDPAQMMCVLAKDAPSLK
jgi:hypothetical protein